MSGFGLVLGGGGVLGAAWTTGALVALQEVHGIDPRDAELIVGTSAGSILAALLAAGVPVGDILAHQQGRDPVEAPAEVLAFDHDTAFAGPVPKGTGGVRPAHLRLGLRAPRFAVAAPVMFAAAMMPPGRHSHAAIGGLVRAVVPSGWAPRPGVLVSAVDLETGRRVAFGSPGAPPVDLADAVMASCSIPGFFSPVVVDGHRYVDGGAISSTNVDLAAGHGLDHVFVLAPQVSFAPDRPRRPVLVAERRWRRRATRVTLREAGVVHDSGTDVTILGPGSQDLEAFGHNVMDVSRRGHVLDTSLRTSRRSLADPFLLDEEVLQRVGRPRRWDESLLPAGGPARERRRPRLHRPMGGTA